MWRGGSEEAPTRRSRGESREQADPTWQGGGGVTASSGCEARGLAEARGWGAVPRWSSRGGGAVLIGRVVVQSIVIFVAWIWWRTC